MPNIKRFFSSYLLLLTAAWWVTAQPDWGALQGVFAWRGVLNQYVGVLGIGVMSLAMILAMRPAVLERRLDGLDKMYRLHKWLGIAGLLIAISHWLIVKGPRWMVEAGWITRGARKPRPPLPDGSLQQVLGKLHGLGETVGEWAFYVAVVLLVLALVKRLPYRRFFQLHRLLPLVYLALVFHSIVLVKFDYWSGPVGIVLALLMALGSVAAVMSLLGRRAGGSRSKGTVLALEQKENVLAVDVQLERGWPGHKPGQFAFVTFHEDEGAHPFTIASAPDAGGRMRFLIKALGDYTRTLPQRLQAGAALKVEGPYGCFTFEGSVPRQVWIGGGIGITPFIARLETLARQPDGKPVDLFHATASYDQAIIDQLQADASLAGVRLHVVWDERDGRLDLKRILNTVPDCLDADVWFCGPAPFGRLLKTQLMALGLPEERFHQELFEMR